MKVDKLGYSFKDRRKAWLICALVSIAMVYCNSAKSADYQIIDVQPGQTVDVYFEVNLTGTVVLRIATRTGLGCAELWWIKWPLGNIKSVGKKCGLVRLAIPGITDLAAAGKLRATGVDAPTKIIAAANERVANSVSLNW